jgi:hydroxypyruvate isomerase
MYAEWGFQAFEYNGLPRHSNAEIESFRKKMDELKMSMGVFVVNSGGWKPSAMVDKQFQEQFFQDVRRAVEIHGIIGNQCATVTSGVAVPNVTFTEQTNHGVEALKRAGDMVGKTKMVLVLEPLNIRVDHAGYFVVFSDHAADIISRVNHPNVRILFDIYHQQISEGNLINHIHKHWNWIGYFQVGDVPCRKEPGTGEVNWRNVFQAIHAKGYRGILGMEHGLSAPGEAGMKKCFEAYREADRWS